MTAWHLLLIRRTADPIDDQHVFVTRGANCWGSGDTPQEALKNCAANAWHNKKEQKFITMVAPKDFEIDAVDGSILANGHVNCPYCTVGTGIRFTLEKEHIKL